MNEESICISTFFNGTIYQTINGNMSFHGISIATFSLEKKMKLWKEAEDINASVFNG